jgi:uncharacterized protein YkwD
MDLERARIDLLLAINRVRAAGCTSAGAWLPPARALVRDPRLDRAAQLHSEEQALRDLLDHVGSGGTSPFDRIRRQGYAFSAAAENIASGSAGAEATLAQWLGSDGHCRALMAGQYVHCGLGRAVARTGTHYWTLDLAAP